MIIEIATAAAMYLAENVTATAAQSDIPQMRPRAALCRDRDPVKIRQCFERKQQQEPDPYAAMWDPNWVSSVTPVREGETASGSAKHSQSKRLGVQKQVWHLSHSLDQTRG
jgi:hypothetical protein